MHHDEHQAMLTHRQMLVRYLLLAEGASQRQRVLVRDRLFVLAAALATQAKLHPLAEFLRSQVLQNNPGHLLGQFPTMQEACSSQPFGGLLFQLLRRFTPERVEQLLAQLDLHPQNVASVEPSPEELAQLVGKTWEALVRHFPQQQTR